MINGIRKAGCPGFKVMMARLGAAVGIICLLFLTGTAGAVETAFAREQNQISQRVFDDAGLFSKEEREKLEESVSEYQERAGTDIIIVTAYDDGSRNAEEYADDFYDEGGFGTGSSYSGVLFLLYMDGPGEAGGELWISTSGTMIRILTDERIEDIRTDTRDYLRQGDYAGGVQVFLEDVDDYVAKGIQAGQYNYDRDTGKISVYRSIRLYEAAFALIVSLAVAASVCAGVKNSYKLKASDRQRSNSLLAYRAQCQFHFSNTSDNLINKFVTTTRVPKVDARPAGSGGGSRSLGGSGRSTTHRSSGGRSHGGGGGRF